MCVVGGVVSRSLLGVAGDGGVGVGVVVLALIGELCWSLLRLLRCW